MRLRFSQQMKCRTALARETLNRKERILCGPLDTKLSKRMMKFCFENNPLRGRNLDNEERREEEDTGLRDGHRHGQRWKGFPGST